MTQHTPKTDTMVMQFIRNDGNVEMTTAKTETLIQVFKEADNLSANLAVDGQLETPLDNGKETIREGIDYNYELIQQLRADLTALQAQVDAIVSCTCSH